MAAINFNELTNDELQKRADDFLAMQQAGEVLTRRKEQAAATAIAKQDRENLAKWTQEFEAQWANITAERYGSDGEINALIRQLEAAVTRRRALAQRAAQIVNLARQIVSKQPNAALSVDDALSQFLMDRNSGTKEILYHRLNQEDTTLARAVWGGIAQSGGGAVFNPPAVPAVFPVETRRGVAQN